MLSSPVRYILVHKCEILKFNHEAAVMKSPFYRAANLCEKQIYMKKIIHVNKGLSLLVFIKLTVMMTHIFVSAVVKSPVYTTYLIKVF